MINTFFAKKTGMTGKYDEKGNRLGVTTLSVPKLVVKGIRTKEKNGYEAVIVDIEDQKLKVKTKEIRTQEKPDVGSEIKVEEIIRPGDIVKVAGISKGKGFAGVVKRYHFRGGPRTHGQSDRERAPGSSGSTTTPGRVLPGTRRAGHMGNKRVSISGMRVLGVDPERKIVSIVGSVPGMGRRKGQLITVTKTL
jgi:large subunit ribosomal protein L3